MILTGILQRGPLNNNWAVAIAVHLSHMTGMAAPVPHSQRSPMQRNEMQTFLERAEEDGRHVFTFDELSAAFPRESRHTLNESLRRMVAAGLLHRAVRGIYFNDQPRKRYPWLAERIAMAMRPGHFTYITCERALAAWGVMSQACFALTLMTTGRSGVYSVPQYRPLRPPPWCPDLKRDVRFICFTHTSQRPEDIQAKVLADYSLLPFAEPEQAVRDFLRRRPNWFMKLDMEIYEDVVEERRQYRAGLAAVKEAAT